MFAFKKYHEKLLIFIRPNKKVVLQLKSVFLFIQIYSI